MPPTLQESVPGHDANSKTHIRTHHAESPCGSVAKIGRKNVQNATVATLAHFEPVFRLFRG